MAENWALFEELVHRHKDDEVDVFLTPECFLDGYAVTEKDWTEKKFAEVAQRVDGSPYIDRLRRLAAKLKAYIIFGFTELVEERFSNCGYCYL